VELVFQAKGRRPGGAISADLHGPRVHHDALEFASGRIVLVNNLYEGQHLTVMQLPAALSSRNGDASVPVEQTSVLVP
jgi:hypothetical protein